MSKIVMHIDVNSAYLSWEAVYALENGAKIDYRMVAAIVGGDPKSRRGIVLAKSTLAKKYGIVTGESLASALKKHGDLLIISPSYGLYMKCSKALENILKCYTPYIQRFSIDEFFIEFRGFQKLYTSPSQLAYKIKEEVKQKLGFTVNIGVSTNKLLAKIAGDFEKPDKVHMLFPNQIKEKLWPLPIGELYMVGRKTLPKLQQMGIATIGDLAQADKNYIVKKLNKFGLQLYDFAHGIENSCILKKEELPKGVGNSTTLKYDVVDKNEAFMVLLSLTEMVCMRLRKKGLLARNISVCIKFFDLSKISHQKRLACAVDITLDVYKIVKQLFEESWCGQPIRHLGVRVSELSPKGFYQYSLLDDKGPALEKRRAIDKVVDEIRQKYGLDSIFRATFAQTKMPPVEGGTVRNKEYPTLKSNL